MSKIKQTLSVVSFFAAILIGFIALFLPPLSVIPNSVLWFTSQLLVFTSSILGINFNVDFMSKKITTKKDGEE